MDQGLQIVPPLPVRAATIAERVDLVVQGFTTEQIEHLCRLRAVYPVIEFVESKQELQRLIFLKWMHNQEPGEIDEPPIAA